MNLRARNVVFMTEHLVIVYVNNPLLKSGRFTSHEYFHMDN